jgi:trehalose 6-phosphate phosphatase
MKQSTTHRSASDEILLLPDDALFVDFDGTLAPIQDNPDTVTLAQEISPVLLSISAHLGGGLAVISGRGLADLESRVPRELWRYGNHGLFHAEPGSSLVDKAPATPSNLIADIHAACAKFDGVRVEPKGPVVAIHYRSAPAIGKALGEALQRVVSHIEGYKLQHGKFVYEAKPLGANKGTTLAEAMLHAPFKGRRPVMFGDDTTDEDAFIAANALGGLSIKVGEGATKAKFRLADVASVHKILKEFECRLRG